MIRRRANPETPEPSASQAVAEGYAACGIKMPELWATEQLEASDKSYWSLIGNMAVEAAKFASSISDAASEAGVHELNKYMSVAFEIPKKLTTGSLAKFPSQYYWPVAQIDYWEDAPWPYSSEQPLAHPALGEYGAKVLSVTQKGELALVGTTSRMVRKTVQRRLRHPQISRRHDYELLWNPAVLNLFDDSSGALAQYVTTAEQAGMLESDEEARATKQAAVLGTWKGMLAKTYERQMHEIERHIDRAPYMP